MFSWDEATKFRLQEQWYDIIFYNLYRDSSIQIVRAAERGEHYSDPDSYPSGNTDSGFDSELNKYKLFFLMLIKMYEEVINLKKDIEVIS